MGEKREKFLNASIHDCTCKCTCKSLYAGQYINIHYYMYIP